MRSSELQTRISKIANKEAALAAIFASRKLKGYENKVLECIETKLKEADISKKVEKLLEPLQDAEKRKIAEVLLSSLHTILLDLVKMHSDTTAYLKTSPRFHKKRKERLDNILETVHNREGYTTRLAKLEGLTEKFNQLGLDSNKIIKLKMQETDSVFKKLRDELNSAIPAELSTVCKFLYR